MTIPIATALPKRMLLAVLLVALSILPAFAVPEEVMEAFESRYGSPEDVDWEVDSNGFWEAKFEKGGSKYRADYTKSGKWVETEKSIRFDDLPDAVQTAVKSEHGDREISEIEEVESAVKGHFFDVEFERQGQNDDYEYNKDGEPLGSIIPGMNSPLPDLDDGTTKLEEITLGGLVMEFGINLLTILIYAYGVYYLRHHNHKMMFLLLAFNLFLFPIFLLSSVLTMGFGFTIFALLALVRLRSENFDKAEVAYLLGAVALTFINSQLSAHMEVAASALVLLTAYFADHPMLWRSAYQTTEIRYRISDTTKMLDRDHLKEMVSKDFNIAVNDIEIDRVDRKEVRLTVVYRDHDIEDRKHRRKFGKKKKKDKDDEKSESEEKSEEKSS